MEKEMYENKNNSQSIEIIDFDDNPFRDPIPEEEPANDEYKPEVPKPDMIQNNFVASTNTETTPFEDVPTEEEFETNTITLNVPKNKANIPSLGIIDDFRNDTPNIVESNHGFESNFNEPAEPEEAEEVTLDEVKPDKIDFEERKPESFDDMIQKTPNVANDFEQVQKVIEKCQSELKELGYRVEYEKFDFETMYQIIFKINKN